MLMKLSGSNFPVAGKYFTSGSSIASKLLRPVAVTARLGAIIPATAKTVPITMQRRFTFEPDGMGRATLLNLRERQSKRPLRCLRTSEVGACLQAMAGGGTGILPVIRSGNGQDARATRN